MASIHETAYPRVKPNMSNQEIDSIFTPSEEDLVLLKMKTKKTLPVTRLGFVILLKYYQYLGRPTNVRKIDKYIKKYIADKIGVDYQVDLNGYKGF